MRRVNTGNTSKINGVGVGRVRRGSDPKAVVSDGARLGLPSVTRGNSPSHGSRGVGADKEASHWGDFDDDYWGDASEWAMVACAMRIRACNSAPGCESVDAHVIQDAFGRIVDCQVGWCRCESDTDPDEGEGPPDCDMHCKNCTNPETNCEHYLMCEPCGCPCESKDGSSPIWGGGGAWFDSGATDQGIFGSRVPSPGTGPYNPNY